MVSVPGGYQLHPDDDDPGDDDDGKYGDDCGGGDGKDGEGQHLAIAYYFKNI